MRYLLDHSVLYNHWTNILFALALVVVVYFFVKKMKAMKQEEELLEKQISELYSGVVLENEDLIGELELTNKQEEKKT